MKTQIETELKLMLDGEPAWLEVREALSAIVPGSRIHQTNVYFDTPTGELRARRWMVRVRKEETAAGAQFEVTAKDRVVDSVGALSSRERTDTLDESDARAVLAMATPLTALEGELCRSLAEALTEPLYPIGAVSNTRDVFVLPSGYLVELDQTTFPDGRVDFEIEMELKGEHQSLGGARAALAEVLPSFDVAALPGSPSKFKRFHEALARLSTAALATGGEG